MNKNKTDYQLTFVNADGGHLLTENYVEEGFARKRIKEFAAFQRLNVEKIDMRLYRLRGGDGGVKVLASIQPVDMD